MTRVKLFEFNNNIVAATLSAPSFELVIWAADGSTGRTWNDMWVWKCFVLVVRHLSFFNTWLAFSFATAIAANLWAQFDRWRYSFHSLDSGRLCQKWCTILCCWQMTAKLNHTPWRQASSNHYTPEVSGWASGFVRLSNFLLLDFIVLFISWNPARWLFGFSFEVLNLSLLPCPLIRSKAIT